MEAFRKTVLDVLAVTAAIVLLGVLGINRSPSNPVTVHLIGAAAPKVQAIVIGAKWCSPCRTLERSIRDEMPKDGWKLAEASDDPAKREAAHVVFDKREDAATIAKYKVESYPTTIIVRDGKEVKRFVGVIKPSDLAEAFNTAGK